LGLHSTNFHFNSKTFFQIKFFRFEFMQSKLSFDNNFSQAAFTRAVNKAKKNAMILPQRPIHGLLALAPCVKQ
jgi:hypothetical protein